MLSSLIRPDHSRELLNPFTLSLTEALAQAVKDNVTADLAQAVKDNVTADLGMIVALWVVWRRKLAGDLIRGTESGYLLTGENFQNIVDDSVREAETRHKCSTTRT